MPTDDQQNPGTSEGQYRPGEGSSGPGGKHRPSYERYGNYGMVKTDSEPEGEPQKPLDNSANGSEQVINKKDPG